MKLLLIVLFVSVFVVCVVLMIWRRIDVTADKTKQQQLCKLQAANPTRFNYALIANLPEPVQRFFKHSIHQNTPLYTVVHIRMHGKFGMGTHAKHKYFEMKAEQMLAAPHGFVWQMSTYGHKLTMSGSDSDSWTRFWLFNLLPIARLGGSHDHALAAFGRCVSEAVFWTPAALLPADNVVWQAISQNRIKVSVTYESMSQSVELIIDQQGKATDVFFQRWSAENKEKEYRWQPFGGKLSNFNEFAGFNLPTKIVAGNHSGTPEYFPFFIVEVDDISFPKSA